MKTSIYLDNAATTKTAQEVVDAMLPYFTENYGNPSSIYDLGTKSKEAITKGREQIAEVLGAKSEEIYFKLIKIKEIISSQQKLNIMQFFIPANIWKNAVQKSLILM